MALLLDNQSPEMTNALTLCNLTLINVKEIPKIPEDLMQHFKQSLWKTAPTAVLLDLLHVITDPWTIINIMDSINGTDFLKMAQPIKVDTMMMKNSLLEAARKQWGAIRNWNSQEVETLAKLDLLVDLPESDILLLKDPDARKSLLVSLKDRMQNMTSDQLASLYHIAKTSQDILGPLSNWDKDKILNFGILLTEARPNELQDIDKQAIEGSLDHLRTLPFKYAQKKVLVEKVAGGEGMSTESLLKLGNLGSGLASSVIQKLSEEELQSKGAVYSYLISLMGSPKYDGSWLSKFEFYKKLRGAAPLEENMIAHLGLMFTMTPVEDVKNLPPELIEKLYPTWDYLTFKRSPTLYIIQRGIPKLQTKPPAILLTSDLDRIPNGLFPGIKTTDYHSMSPDEFIEKLQMFCDCLLDHLPLSGSQIAEVIEKSRKDILKLFDYNPSPLYLKWLSFNDMVALLGLQKNLSRKIENLLFPDSLYMYMAQNISGNWTYETLKEYYFLASGISCSLMDYLEPEKILYIMDLVRGRITRTIAAFCLKNKLRYFLDMFVSIDAEDKTKAAMNVLPPYLWRGIDSLVVAMFDQEELLLLESQACGVAIGQIGRLKPHVLLTTIERTKRYALVQHSLDCMEYDKTNPIDMHAISQLKHLSSYLPDAVISDMEAEVFQANLNYFDHGCFSEATRAIIRTKLVELYGDPPSWTATTLSDFHCLLYVFTEDDLKAVQWVKMENDLTTIASCWTVDEDIQQLYSRCRIELGTDEAKKFDDSIAQVYKYIALQSMLAIKGWGRLSCPHIILAGPAAIQFAMEDIKNLTGIDIQDCLDYISEFPWEKEKRNYMWERIKTDVATPENMTAPLFQSLGTIAISATTDEFNQMPFNDLDTISMLGKIQEWSPEQLSLLADRVQSEMIDIQDSANLQPVHLISMGHILCGFSEKEVSTIEAEIFLNSVSAIGQLQICTSEVLTTLKSLAEKDTVYGAVSKWSGDVVNQLGIIIAGLTCEELQLIPNTSFEGLTLNAVKNFPSALTKCITSYQMEYTTVSVKEELGVEHSVAESSGKAVESANKLQDTQEGPGISPGKNAAVSLSLPALVYLIASKSLFC